MNSSEILYRQQIRDVYLLLSDDAIPKGEKEKLQNYFISSFYEIVKISFDASLDPEKLTKYISSNDINSKYTNALFISKTIENPKTYDYINYFCYNFIKIVKNTYSI